MTKSNFYLEFFLILLIFIVPPIAAPFFQEGAQILAFGSFSAWTVVCFFLAAFLFFQERSAKIDMPAPYAKILKIAFKIGDALLALGLLYIVSALLEMLGMFLNKTPKAQIVPPRTPLEFVFCALTFVIAAFYEEVLFRGYLPYALKSLNKGSKPWQAVSEVAAVLLFAFGHAYNGWLAVVNAVFAGVILRRCALKTLHIWAGFAAHLAFNVLTFVYMITLS